MVAEPLFHGFEAGEADGHYAGLGVDGLAQRVFGAVEHNVGQRALERHINLVKDFARGGGFVVELASHSHGLRALSGE